MATLLCAKQPKAKEGAAWVRRYRLGRRDVPDSAKLAEVMLRALRRYAEVHPALTSRQAVSALFQVRERVLKHGPVLAGEPTGGGNKRADEVAEPDPARH